MKPRSDVMREELERARREWDEVKRANSVRREALAAALPRATKSDPPPALAWWVDAQVPVG